MVCHAYKPQLGAIEAVTEVVQYAALSQETIKCSVYRYYGSRESILAESSKTPTPSQFKGSYDQ
jgi:hypothetical protein